MSAKFSTKGISVNIVRRGGKSYNYPMSEQTPEEVKVDPFTSNEPAVSSKLNIIAAGEDNPKVCVGACEG